MVKVLVPGLAPSLSVAWCMIGTLALRERWGTMPITNQQVTEHAFLHQLYADEYFPDHVLDKGRTILLKLCERIEAER